MPFKGDLFRIPFLWGLQDDFLVQVSGHFVYSFGLTKGLPYGNMLFTCSRLH